MTSLWEYLLLINYIICQNFPGCWPHRIETGNSTKAYSHVKGIQQKHKFWLLIWCQGWYHLFFFFWLKKWTAEWITCKRKFTTIHQIGTFSLVYFPSSINFHTTPRIFFIFHLWNIIIYSCICCVYSFKCYLKW